jgi:Domain of unknown function (DUF4291)
VSDTPIPLHQIRAVHDANTIRVYQAYADPIADAALAHGTFVSPPFKMERMTWVKPSFLWMMYRAGWGRKDEGQRRILAIDITHEGLAWALAHSCPSHPQQGWSAEHWRRIKAESPVRRRAVPKADQPPRGAASVRAPVRVQWDPERGLRLEPLPYRAIQIGLSGEAVERYVTQWIRSIEEVTALAHRIHGLVVDERWDDARAALPRETPYEPASRGTNPG